MTNLRLPLVMIIHLLIVTTTTFVASFRATTTHYRATANHRPSRRIAPSSSSSSPFGTTKYHDSGRASDDGILGDGPISSASVVAVASTFIVACASVPPAYASYLDGAVATTHDASSFSSSVSSMMLLAGSTLANPIGEAVGGVGGGSDLATSFGQWFFLLYVIVSLLAGGKEMLGRMQRSMTDDDSK